MLGDEVLVCDCLSISELYMHLMEVFQNLEVVFHMATLLMSILGCGYFARLILKLSFTVTK